MTEPELNTLKKLLWSDNLSLASIGVDICIAQKKHSTVRALFAERLVQLNDKGMYLPTWGELRAILRLMKEDAKRVLYDHENVRLNNKIAGRFIGLADTTGDVVFE